MESYLSTPVIRFKEYYISQVQEVTYEVKMKKAILDGDVFNDEDEEDENEEDLI